MIFGRKNKSRQNSVRRAHRQAESREFKPVASEERSALLSQEAVPIQEPEQSLGEAEGEFTDMDPSKSLMAGLTLFHNAVSQGQAGAAQTEWSDECMSELIAVAEIAATESWDDILRPLTDTARILQTYENAQAANGCIPFLAKAYEVLSLMAGDILSGQVRDDVKEKWQECFQFAVDQIESNGLVLISEGGEAVSSSESEIGGEEEGPFSMPQEGDSGDSIAHEGIPSLDDLPSLGEDGHDFGESAPVEMDWLVSSNEDTSESSSPLDALDSLNEELDETIVDEASQISFGAGPDPSQEKPAVRGPFDELCDLGDDDQIEAVAAQEPEAEMPGQVAEVEEEAAEVEAEVEEGPYAATLLDNLSEKLANAQSSGSDFGQILHAMQEDVASLKVNAVDKKCDAAVQLCEIMSKLCDAATQRQGDALDNEFVELAYAFGGAYMDACTAPDAESVSNWGAECSSLIEKWSVPAEEGSAEEPDADAVPADSEAEEVTEESGEEDDDIEDGVDLELLEGATPEVLLKTAQKAAAQGNVADAKLLALSAAANFAILDSEKAENSVKEAETRLKEGQEAATSAREAVNAAEASVSEIEAQVAEAKDSFSVVQERVGGLASSIESQEGTIADFNEQIKALESKRDAELERLGEMNSEIEGAKSDEDAAQRALDERTNDEHEARIALENARQDTKRLEHKRVESEAALEEARDEFSHQRSSLEDIEQTISQIRKKENSQSEDPDSMLF